MDEQMFVNRNRDSTITFAAFNHGVKVEQGKSVVRYNVGELPDWAAVVWLTYQENNYHGYVNVPKEIYKKLEEAAYALYEETASVQTRVRDAEEERRA